MERSGMVALLSYLGAQDGDEFVVIFDDLKRFARDTEFHLNLRRTLNGPVALAEGYIGGWKWETDDGEQNTIRNRMVAGLLRLNFRFRRNGRPWKDVEQLIAIRYQPCQFGGETALFLCPVCNAPRRYLYSADARFLCRGCYRLPYATQRERDADRAGRKARKLRRKLGVDVSPEMPIWPKPKGMHWRTFEAMAQEIQGNEQVLMQHMALLLGRIKRQPRHRASTRSFWT